MMETAWLHVVISPWEVNCLLFLNFPFSLMTLSIPFSTKRLERFESWSSDFPSFVQIDLEVSDKGNFRLWWLLNKDVTSTMRSMVTWAKPTSFKFSIASPLDPFVYYAVVHGQLNTHLLNSQLILTPCWKMNIHQYCKIF